MQIERLMTRDPETIRPDAFVSEAAQKMRACRVGPLPVVHEGEAVGMLTDRDIVLRGVAAGRDPERTRVAEIMSTGPVTCRPSDAAPQAARRMADRHVRRLVVEDQDGRLAGIVSLADLAACDDPNGTANEVLARLNRHEEQDS